MDVSNSIGCGQRTGGDLVCWGYQNPWDYAGPVDSYSVGWDTVCAIVPSSQLLCRGWLQGEVPPSSPGTFDAVSVGEDYVCAIRTTGALVCWHGLDVEDAGPFASISESGRHTCAIRTSGAVRCWGANDFGQAP
jgi:hypothetical protein